ADAGPARGPLPVPGERDADARRQHDVLVPDLVGVGREHPQEPPGELDRRPRLALVRRELDEDGELVAAPARHRLVGLDVGAQPPAACASTWSPAACPSESFTAVKPSRSTNTTATSPPDGCRDSTSGVRSSK